MLFRFVEYNYSNFEDDKYADPRFICGLKIDNNYECMNRMLLDAIGKDINLAEDWYMIDGITYGYSNKEGSVFYVNVWCVSI